MQERSGSVFPLNRTLLVSATREGENGVGVKGKEVTGGW